MSNYNKYFELNNDLFESDLANDAFEYSNFDNTIDDIQYDEQLNEDAFGRTIAIGSGLTPLGAVSAFYDLEKEKAAKQALAQIKGEPADMYDAENNGSKLLHTIGASVPILGMLATNNAYNKRLKAEKELRKALGMTADEIENEAPIK